MLTNVAVRWNEKHGSYRHENEPTINPALHEVAEIKSDTTARGFIERHHYSGSYVAARFRYGLYRSGQLVGCAVFSNPMNARVLTNLFPGNAQESVELGRFLLLDSVEFNGETWFLGRCFELLRAEGLIGVVSHSDPTARTNADGTTVFKGHIGKIYKGHNALLLGRTKARILRLLPDGRAFCERTLQKIRWQERGWEAAVEELYRHGAEPLASQDPREWVNAQLARLTRPLKHPGNLRYAWGLRRSVHKHVASLPGAVGPGHYPKLEVIRNAFHITGYE